MPFEHQRDDSFIWWIENKFIHLQQQNPLASRRSAGGSLLFKTAMNSKPRTIEQQINILKSRGMKFSDEENAKEQLARTSYFRLKYYWKDLIEDNETGEFVEGTDFNSVIRRHEFDHILRHTIFEAVGVFEVALRAKIIYHLSQVTNNGLWYLDANLFENHGFHEEFVLDLKYEFQRSTEPFVKEFLNNNPDWDVYSMEGPNPEAWMIIEVATFGTLSKMYKNLKSQLPARASIANDFGLYSAKELTNWIETISLIRNVVAHHGRLWNRAFGKMVMDLRTHRNPWLSSPLTDNQRRKPYGVIAALAYLCKSVKPDCQVAANIRKLMEEYSDLPIHQIGFARNWEKEPLWR